MDEIVTIRLTPEVLAGAYAFLRATQPLSRWKLPPAEAIRFKVIRHQDRYGHHYPATAARPAVIAVSETKVGHGTDFKRKATLVCKHHGFDPKEF